MSLCADCNCALCCDGTFYYSADVQEHELSVVSEFLDVQHSQGAKQAKPTRYFFRQPCQKCKNDQCSIYLETRPAICGKYRCQLLDGHLQGMVSTEEAKELIDRVKFLRDLLRPQMQEFTGCSSDLSFQDLLGRTVKKLDQNLISELPPPYQRMSLNIALFQVIIVKHFDSSQSEKVANRENVMTSN